MSYNRYQQPPPSPIEISFWEAARPRIPNLQREVWIDQKYRVDFFIPEHKIVIELYGYEHHKEKHKLTRDAQRERYLQKRGYQVVRFTGSEIHKNVSECVEEVLAILERSKQSARAQGQVNSSAEAKIASIAASDSRPKPQRSSLKTWQKLTAGAMVLLVCSMTAILALLLFNSFSQAELPPLSTAVPLLAPTITPTPDRYRIPTPPPEVIQQIQSQQLSILGWAICFGTIFSIPMGILAIISSFFRRILGKR